MKNLTTYDAVADITLGHPDFLRWRKTLAARDPELHAQLDQDNLFRLFEHRHSDDLGQIMDEVRAEQANPRSLPDPVQVGKASWEAEQAYHQAVEAYAAWEKHAKEDTRFEHLTKEERYMEFAARDEPATRPRLEWLHNVQSLERKALAEMAGEDGFKQWMLQMQAEAAKPDASSEALRHQTLSLNQALSEYKSQGRDGYEQMRAIHDQQNAAFQAQPPQDQINELAARAQSLQWQIKRDQIDFTYSDDPSMRESYAQQGAVPTAVETPSASPEAPSAETAVEPSMGDRLKNLMSQAGQVFDHMAAATEGVFDAYSRERGDARQDRQREHERM